MLLLAGMLPALDDGKDMWLLMLLMLVMLTMLDGNEAKQWADSCRLISFLSYYRSAHCDCLRRPWPHPTHPHHARPNLHTRDGQHPWTPRRSNLTKTTSRYGKVKKNF